VCSAIAHSHSASMRQDPGSTWRRRLPGATVARCLQGDAGHLLFGGPDNRKCWERQVLMAPARASFRALASSDLASTSATGSFRALASSTFASASATRSSRELASSTLASATCISAIVNTASVSAFFRVSYGSTSRCATIASRSWLRASS